MVYHQREILLKKNTRKLLAENTPVRTQYKRKVFDKGYYPNWKDEVHYISKNIKGNNKPLYKIKDEKLQEIDQRFYPEELQEVKPVLHRVEYPIKYRKKGKEVFVKWLNYPDSFNSWIKTKDLKNIVADR